MQINLEYLDFSINDLSKLTNLVYFLINNKLKVLILKGCNLDIEEIQKIIHFSNLEKVYFSFTYKLQPLDKHQKLQISLIKKKYEKNKTMKFKFKGLLNFYKIINDYSIKSDKEIFKFKLKKIKLRNCDLKNKEFIETLIYIEDLEILKLGLKFHDFDIKKTLQARTKYSLKELDTVKLILPI